MVPRVSTPCVHRSGNHSDEKVYIVQASESNVLQAFFSHDLLYFCLGLTTDSGCKDLCSDENVLSPNVAPFSVTYKPFGLLSIDMDISRYDRALF